MDMVGLVRLPLINSSNLLPTNSQWLEQAMATAGKPRYSAANSCHSRHPAESLAILFFYPIQNKRCEQRVNQHPIYLESPHGEN